MKKTDGCLDEVSKCVGAFSVFRIRTPAGLNGHADTVRVLVAELGADVNVRNSIGNTPMHFAALEGQSELIRVFEMLGTDVGEEDSYEITPLHYSAANGHANTARVLVVELGACADETTRVDVNVRNIVSNTLVHLAELKGHREVIRVLQDFDWFWMWTF